MTVETTGNSSASGGRVLVLTVGLPRSGKSTWARRQGCPVVNPDSVRLAIHGQRYVQLAEPFVQATVRAMVRALFLAGHDLVILDATNVSRKRRAEWCGYDTIWKTCFFPIDAPADECIRRARATDDEEIVPVIERMAEAAEPLGPDEPVWQP